MSVRMNKREFERLLQHLDKVNKLLETYTLQLNQSVVVSDLTTENNNWRNHIVGYMNSNVLHHTEEKYPEQTQMFREIIEKMYQTFLDKNKDYSKYNILATGMVGLITRFWDKTARLMHIMGFDIGTGNYTGEIKATNEAIEDSFYDSAVYSIIALIYRAGKWGK